MSTIAPRREVKTHPLNTDFHWSMPEPQGLQALTPAQYRQFDALGFGVYSCTVTAHETATNLDLIDTFTLRLLPVPT